MSHVSLGDFDKVGDEVVATAELNIYLGEAVGVADAELNETVVDHDRHDDQDEEDATSDDKTDLQWTHEARSRFEGKRPSDGSKMLANCWE